MNARHTWPAFQFFDFLLMSSLQVVLHAKYLRFYLSFSALLGSFKQGSDFSIKFPYFSFMSPFHFFKRLLPMSRRIISIHSVNDIRHPDTMLIEVLPAAESQKDGNGRKLPTC